MALIGVYWELEGVESGSLEDLRGLITPVPQCSFHPTRPCRLRNPFSQGVGWLTFQKSACCFWVKIQALPQLQSQVRFGGGGISDVSQSQALEPVDCPRGARAQRKRGQAGAEEVTLPSWPESRLPAATACARALKPSCSGPGAQRFRGSQKSHSNLPLRVPTLGGIPGGWVDRQINL